MQEKKLIGLDAKTGWCASALLCRESMQNIVKVDGSGETGCTFQTKHFFAF
jgi:hypothetical protein